MAIDPADLEHSCAEQHNGYLGSIGGTILSDGGSPVIERGICWDYSRNPTINTVYKTEEGGGTGEFTSTMTGLPPHTKVYVRAYATNANGTGYGNEQVFNTEAEEFGTLTDIDNNTYRTMEVGAQIWMVENLKTTRFSNGDEISYLADNTDWTLTPWPAGRLHAALITAAQTITNTEGFITGMR